MKTKYIAVAAFVIFLGWLGSAQASVQVQAYFTGDNITSAFYMDGAGPTPITIGGGALDTWQQTKTSSFTLPSEAGGDRTYELIFRVNNRSDPGNGYGSPGNPAAFLADLTISGYLYPSEERLSSSSSWSWIIDTGKGIGAPPDFTNLTWTSATEWSYEGTSPNNGGVNIWTNGNGDNPISDISLNARWIWGDKNGTDLGTDVDPDPENWLWIKTDIIVPPIPEPATIIIWSLLGGASWLGMRVWRRRGIAVPATPTRQPWSDESRMAIHQMIERGYRR